MVLIEFVNQFSKHGMNDLNVPFTYLPKFRRHLSYYNFTLNEIIIDCTVLGT